MEELIKTFHIDYKLIIAQLINFVLVLFVFKKYAYGPILKMLNDRSAKIEKGLEEAKEAARKLSQAEEIKRELVSEAKREAHEIVLKAEKSAEKLKNEIIGESKVSAEKMLKKASYAIEEEKRRILSEIKDDISQMVILGMGKLFEESGKTREFEKKAVDRIEKSRN